MAYPIVHILVLNWNGIGDTIECVRSLEKLEYSKYRVSVVDNGSTDGSVRKLRALFPQLHVIENGRNLGFAEGNNVGMRSAIEGGADYVLLLNNDTVVHPSMLRELVAAAVQRTDAGLIGPKIYYYGEPTRIWSAGGHWDEKGMCFEQIGDGEEDRGQYEDIRETEFIVGCAMFIPVAVLRKIGLLEPRYFLNYEEIDFCSRVKRAGLQNILAPRAMMWHKVAASFGGEQSPLKTYFTFRNRLLWAERNLRMRQIVAVHLSVYSQGWQRFLRPAVQGLRVRGARLRSCVWTLRSAWSSPLNRAWLYAVRDYWLRRFGACPQIVWDLQSRWKQLGRVGAS